MLFWVLRIHPREYGGILLIDPMLRSTVLHLIGRKYPTFGMGQINFHVTLLSVQ